MRFFYLSNFMIKIWSVFKKEKKFVRYTAQSEICSSVMGLFCFIAVFSHSQVYSLIKVSKSKKKIALIIALYGV